MKTLNNFTDCLQIQYLVVWRLIVIYNFIYSCLQSIENWRLVSRVCGKRGGAGCIVDTTQAADSQLLGDAPVTQPCQTINTPHVEVSIRTLRWNAFC